MRLIVALLLAFFAPKAMPGEEMVSVPKAQIDALVQEHIVLKATVDAQAKRIASMADAALACYANFQHFRES